MPIEGLVASLPAAAAALWLALRIGLLSGFVRMAGASGEALRAIRETDPDDPAGDARLLAAANEILASSAGALGRIVAVLAAFGLAYLPVAALAVGGLDAAFAALTDPGLQIGLLAVFALLLLILRRVRL